MDRPEIAERALQQLLVKIDEGLDLVEHGLRVAVAGALRMELRAVARPKVDERETDDH
jgi:hypothetical protein